MCSLSPKCARKGPEPAAGSQVVPSCAAASVKEKPGESYCLPMPAKRKEPFCYREAELLYGVQTGVSLMGSQKEALCDV